MSQFIRFEVFLVSKIWRSYKKTKSLLLIIVLKLTKYSVLNSAFDFRFETTVFNFVRARVWSSAMWNVLTFFTSRYAHAIKVIFAIVTKYRHKRNISPHNKKN